MVLGSLAGGAAVIILALFGSSIMQRVRPVRRCPKCWYTLHCATMKCSECGYAARHEHQLFKGRRHWRWAMVGVCMLAASYALHVTPEVRDRGWPAAFSMTVKLGLLPWLRPDDAELLPHIQGAGGDVSALRWRDRVYLDLYHATTMLESHRWWNERLVRFMGRRHERLEGGQTVTWRSEADRLLAMTTWRDGIIVQWPRHRFVESPQVVVRSRDVWVQGEAVYLTLDVAATGADHSGLQVEATVADATGRVLVQHQRVAITSENKTGCGQDLASQLKVPAEAFQSGGSGGLTLHVTLSHEHSATLNGLPIRAWRTVVYPTQTIEWDVKLADDVAELLDAVSSTTFERELRESMHPVLMIDPIDATSFELELALNVDFEGSPTVESFLQAMCIGAIVEVRLDGSPIARGRLLAGGRSLNDGLPLYVLDAQQLSHVDLQSSSAKWTVHVIGDPYQALRDFETSRYWSGEVQVPLRVH